jgi:hypothetical protein
MQVQYDLMVYSRPSVVADSQPSGKFTARWAIPGRLMTSAEIGCEPNPPTKHETPRASENKFFWTPCKLSIPIFGPLLGVQDRIGDEPLETNTCDNDGTANELVDVGQRHNTAQIRGRFCMEADRKIFDQILEDVQKRGRSPTE